MKHEILRCKSCDQISVDVAGKLGVALCPVCIVLTQKLNARRYSVTPSFALLCDPVTGTMEIVDRPETTTEIFSVVRAEVME